MSLYSEYITERTDDEIIETEEGFITWRYLNEDQVYIVDLYIRPAFRKNGEAAKLADHVVHQAKSRGCKELLGTVNPSTHGATVSLDVLRAYGMTLKSASDNLIIFKKDI